jgi:hypothetical protein
MLARPYMAKDIWPCEAEVGHPNLRCLRYLRHREFRADSSCSLASSMLQPLLHACVGRREGWGGELADVACVYVCACVLVVSGCGLTEVEEIDARV